MLYLLRVFRVLVVVCVCVCDRRYVSYIHCVTLHNSHVTLYDTENMSYNELSIHHHHHQHLRLMLLQQPFSFLSVCVCVFVMLYVTQCKVRV